MTTITYCSKFHGEIFSRNLYQYKYNSIIEILMPKSYAPEVNICRYMAHHWAKCPLLCIQETEAMHLFALRKI
jgi:hypothetical protein